MATGTTADGTMTGQGNTLSIWDSPIDWGMQLVNGALGIRGTYLEQQSKLDELEAQKKALQNQQNLADWSYTQRLAADLKQNSTVTYLAIGLVGAGVLIFAYAKLVK